MILRRGNTGLHTDTTHTHRLIAILCTNDWVWNKFFTITYFVHMLQYVKTRRQPQKRKYISSRTLCSMQDRNHSFLNNSLTTWLLLPRPQCCRLAGYSC